MMAVMLLGMPPVHSYITGTGLNVSRGGDRMEPRTYPPVLTRESRGIPATGEQNKPRALHKTSSVGQDESATLRILQQTQLEMKEMLRAHQLEMEGMWRTFQLEMEERKRTSQLEWGEAQGKAVSQAVEARVGGANLPIDGGGTASNN